MTAFYINGKGHRRSPKTMSSSLVVAKTTGAFSDFTIENYQILYDKIFSTKKKLE